MSDAESLLLVLVIIYLIDCCRWVPRGSLAFVAPFAESGRHPRFRCRQPGRSLGNERGELLFCNPFPPLGTVFVSPLAPNGPAAFATAPLETLLREFQRHTALLRVLCNLLWVQFFLLAPALVWVPGAQRLFWPWLALSLLLILAIAVCYFRAHRALYPGKLGDRLTHLVTMIVCPPAAVRATDALSRPLLVECHALATAQVLCDRDQFRALARRTLLALRYPTPPVDEHHSAQPAAVEAWLVGAGVDLGELLKPPVPADPSCRSYCPRCWTQYSVPTGTCADCAGIALEPFAPPVTG